jgi:site-specific recombinase XerD
MQPSRSLDLTELQNAFFVKLKGDGKSTNTLKNYRTDLDCFNNYLLKNQRQLDISQFDIPQVLLYGQYLEQRYTSDNSRRRRVQALRIFFDYLVGEGHVGANPVRKLPTSPKFLDIPRPTPLIDIKVLWEYLLSEGFNPHKMTALMAKRNQVILLLIYGAALKVSDLSQLKVDHIMLTPEGARVMVDGGKRDPYTIPLPEIFPIIYEDYLKRLKEMKKISNLTFDQILFNANPHCIIAGGLSPRGLEMIFEDLRQKLMIELTPKSLRQACIFKWIKQKESDSLIKEWMGVAPSYGLKPYREIAKGSEFSYQENFLKEALIATQKKLTPKSR